MNSLTARHKTILAVILGVVVIAAMWFTTRGEPGDVGASPPSPSESATVSVAPQVPAPSSPAPSPSKPVDLAANADTTLTSVIPTWASLDTTKKVSSATWVNSWRGKNGVSPDFITQSTNTYGNLWFGAVRSQVSVGDAKIVSKEQLWSQGDRSVWRVTVERAVTSNAQVTAVNTTESMTWDFLLTRNNTRISGYSDPLPANQTPDSFTPAT